MDLTPREMDKLWIYVVADLASRRRARGVKLNGSEAIALISEAILEAARDGKSVSECMELGRHVVRLDDVMPDVPDLVRLIQVEATFRDGSKLVSCHDPITA